MGRKKGGSRRKELEACGRQFLSIFLRTIFVLMLSYSEFYDILSTACNCNGP